MNKNLVFNCLSRLFRFSMLSKCSGLFKNLRPLVVNSKSLKSKKKSTQHKYLRARNQGAFHVVNPEDLRREIESLIGVAAYSLLPWRGGATIFCFTRRKCWRDGVIYNYCK